MLSLENYVHEEQPLEKFLYNFFTRYNENYHTIDENGMLQTPKGKSRSLGDITDIVNSYYPNTTMDVVKEKLLDFKSKLVGHYCGDIEKRVYSHSDLRAHWEQCDEGKADEYGEVISYRKEDE